MLRRSEKRRLAIATIALGLAAAAVLSAAVVAASAGWPRSYAPIANGRFHGRSWQLGAAGHGRQRCFQLTLRRGRALSRAENCGPDSELPVDWKRSAGVAERDGTAAVELELTSPRVHRLKLLVEHFGTRRGSSWVDLPTRALHPGQALRAGLENNFRYAVVRQLGGICISRYIAFDRFDQRVDSGATPCEF